MTTTSSFVYIHNDARDGGVVVDQTGKHVGGTLEPIEEYAESLANESSLEKHVPPTSEATLKIDRFEALTLNFLVKNGHA